MQIKTLARQIIDALYPEGAAWKPKCDGNMDKLRNGQAANWQTLIKQCDSVADYRNPLKIDLPLLADIEREFGVNPRLYLTTETRRNSLLSRVYMQNSISSYTKLQKKLDAVGFGKGGYGLIVIPNESPACNLDILLEKTIGYYLANDIRYSSNINPIVIGEESIGADNAYIGYFDGFEGEVVEFFTPPARYWPAVFLVCQSVKSRNEDGSINDVEGVNLPSFRRQELHKLILETKPLGTWALIFATYSAY
ncbi:MAG: hypothetical protein Pg6A_20220 [Termitinemataceae bacterium]|nr:MAG: hypothetical protein Pg6A_20220 [Termitinemataceae bacterium]